jgi:hypothetical protein
MLLFGYELNFNKIAFDSFISKYENVIRMYIYDYIIENKDELIYFKD